MKEYLLTTNAFKEPETATSSEAYAILIMRLLLLEPGTNPLHPQMGVGLRRYRFLMEDDMGKLQSLIQDQVNTYLPSDFADSTKVSLSIKPSHYLSIVIESQDYDTSFIYDTEESDTPIELSKLLN